RPFRIKWGSVGPFPRSEPGGGRTPAGRFLCAQPFQPARFRSVATGRPERAPGVAAAELVEPAARDGPAEIRHEPLVEPNIMHRNQNRAKHLAGKKVMPDRPPGEVLARVAVAARL